MSDKHQPEVYSADVQEMMEKIPGWIIRWGLTLFFSIFIILIAGSFFFRSADIVSAPIIITTINPPATLMSKVGGKIENILVKESAITQPDELIAIIENPANTQDVLQLNENIKMLSGKTDWDNVVQSNVFTQNFVLGEIQGSYIAFQKVFEQFRYYIVQGYLRKKIDLLQIQLIKHDEYAQKLMEQYDFSKKDLALSFSSIERDSILFSKNYITLSDYERSKQIFIQKQSSYAGFEATLKNNEISVLRLQENIIELQFQLQRELTQHRIGLDESIKLLASSISQWEEKYLIRSPVNGRVTFTKFWSENQVISNGDILATVVTLNRSEIIGKAVIPTSGIGKVKEGQRVNIMLSGFPYLEFGKLTGYVRSISLVPEGDGYLADIELTDGMISTYNKELRFIAEMKGTAEIVTEEMPLIYRFINPIKSIFKNRR